MDWKTNFKDFILIRFPDNLINTTCTTSVTFTAENSGLSEFTS
jgi:hypothetical protein